MNASESAPSTPDQHGRGRPLDAIFRPRSVAVIGASERPGSVGRTILWNLISNPFGGTVFPVNAKRSSVLGIKAYPSVGQVPEGVDLAVIATPAATVPGVVRECVEAGVKGAVIISAGFKEIGAQGEALEREILAEARAGGLRIIGPNCLGVMRPGRGFNATFARRMARPGSVGFISQSGALLTSILDWSFRENVGFSAFISIGSMLDVDWGDLIYYLGDDPKTKSILVYMESIGNARSFLSAAREVALQKPIIVIKAGRTQQAAQAAASHTGSLAGSDEVLSAAFRRTGVLRVDSIADLFYTAEVLSKQPRAQGPRLTIVTNAGGPGVLATDALITGGGELAPLSDASREALDAVLPEHWSHGNPVDIIGDAQPDRFAKAVEIGRDDDASDGLLVVLSPQAMTDPTGTAEALRPLARGGKKPVLASWMGGAEVAPGEAVLNDAGIPTFSYPDTAARVFNYLWRYNYNLRGLYETPMLPEDAGDGSSRRARAKAILDGAREAGRTLLTEAESKALLAAYDVPTVETRVATDAEEAVQQAEAIGYPVVLKLHSETITHKTDVDGVWLDLHDAPAVRHAYGRIEEGARRHAEDGFDGVSVQPMIRQEGYELIIGSSLDPQFGPVLLFGSGGSLVEVYRDRALALPPLTTTLARRLMEQTRIYEALKGVRGRAPVDLEALEKLLVRFSQLIAEQACIKELDINPLLASPDGLIALDARVVLHPADVPDDELPRLAIRPYPRRYIDQWTMKNGEEVTIRPIRPEDEPLLIGFHESLSERSVYLRYAGILQFDRRVSHERLARVCFIDYDREMALVVERNDPETGEPRVIAVGRLTKLRGTDDGEFAAVISDDFQGQGLGTELLRRLIEVGRDEGLERIIAEILWQNRAMQAIVRKHGFEVQRPEMDDPMVQAVLTL